MTVPQTTSFSAVSFNIADLCFCMRFPHAAVISHSQLAAQRSLELTQRLLEVGTCWDTPTSRLEKTLVFSVFSEEFEKACGQEETQAALQKLLDRRPPQCDHSPSILKCGHVPF